jgi:hypothetical protein
MLQKRSVTAWMLKISLSAFPAFVTFLLMSYTICNAQDPKTCLNQFTATGSISKGFFYTAVQDILGHFTMIPDAMSPKEGNYVGETLGADIDKSTLINGKPVEPQNIDKILGSGKKVLVNFKTAPELLTPSCSSTVDAKLTGTVALLTITE